MDAESIKLIAVAATIFIGTIAPAFAIGKIGSEAANAIGRNPEAGSKIQTAMILAIAFTEALAIYALVIALIIKFTYTTELSIENYELRMLGSVSALILNS
jgi:F-type H+-transporting ATPase subunit c